jgi:hypothetical protein
MDAIGKALDAEAKQVEREEIKRADADRKAATALLKALERGGINAARLPPGVARTSGERGASARRSSRGSTKAFGSVARTIAGLSDALTETVFLPFATLRPPYDWEWTWTKWINYAPGQLEAYAHKADGRFGFECDSYASSNQLNRSKARAAVGVRFQPTELGVLGIRPLVRVDASWSLRWNYAVACTFGWTGILVQTFTPDGTLVQTPVDKKGREFNEDGGGSIIPPAEMNVTLPGGEDFWGTSMIVRPSRRYAIWIWCGGGIRAAGWQTIAGVNVGSDAKSELDVEVPSIALYFTPFDELAGKLRRQLSHERS